MWGQTASGAMSRKSPGPDQNGLSLNTTPRPYSTPPTADTSLNEKSGINYSTTESMVNDNDEEIIYDPEAAQAGQTHRPSMCAVVKLTPRLLTLNSDSHPFFHGWPWYDVACFHPNGWSCSGNVIK